MTDTTAGTRIVTLLDEASIIQLLLDVSQQVSQSQYLFLPHPGSPTAYAAAPQEAPAFVEVVTDFHVEQTPQFSIVSPTVSWRADSADGSHPASEMIIAEFRYAVGQVDPSAYELPRDEGGRPVAQAHTEEAPASPGQPPGVAQYEAVWVLIGPENRRMPLGTHNIVGRKPSPHPQLTGAHLIALRDPARSLSKMHAVIETSGELARVTDLGSTNGSRVVSQGATSVCPPNTPTQIHSGDQLLFGELEVTIVRETA